MRTLLLLRTALLVLAAQTTYSLIPITFHAKRLPPAALLSTVRPSLVRPGPSRKNHSRHYYKLADRIFQEADTNKDGYVDLSETYELVLKIYVKINRQAPIEPPSKATIYQIFRESDINNDNRISRAEFSKMASILLRRAMLKLVSHKAVSLVGAPLLAEYVVRLFARRKWGFNTATKILPPKMLQVVTSMTFWRTTLLVFFVASLGNMVLGLVSFCLDYTRSAPSSERE